MRVVTPRVVEVIGAPWCSHCRNLKKELTEANIEFTYRDLDEDIEAVHKLIRCESKTIPQVFLGDENIGGRTDTLQYFGLTGQ
jgi:glutaredoxin